MIPFTMSNHEHWTEFRERLEQALQLPGWNQTKLAATAKVAPTTISTFRGRPSAGLTARSYQKLAPVVNQLVPPKPTGQMSGNENSDRVQSPDESFIPVVGLDDFAFDAEEAVMDERLESVVRHMHLLGAKRSRHFAVEVLRVLKLRKGMLVPGDLVIINRKDKAPRKDEVVLIPTGRRGGVLADVDEEGGQLVAVLPGGEKLKKFDIVGIVDWKLDWWRVRSAP